MSISQKTKDAIGSLIAATDQFGAYKLTSVMKQSGVSCALVPSESGEHAHFRGIDWTKEDSVGKLLPIVQEAYRRSRRLPKLLKFKHEMRLRSALERDHLSFDMVN